MVARWEVAMVTGPLCCLATLGETSHWCLCFCAFHHEQCVHFSARMLFHCQMKLICTSCVRQPIVVRSHLTSLRLENSRPGISSAGSHSTYALVPLNFPLSHSHTSSTNAQLTSIWQQGWSAFKWCFVKLDEVDVGVVADSPFLGFKKLNVL